MRLKGVVVLIAIGLLVILIVIASQPIMRSGVSEGNSSTLASNYSGFNETVNSFMWWPLVLIIFFAGLAIYLMIKGK